MTSLKSKIAWVAQKFVWLLKKLVFILLGMAALRWGVPAVLWALALVGEQAHSLALRLGIPGVASSPADDGLGQNALIGFVSIVGVLLALLALWLLEGIGRFVLDTFLDMARWVARLPSRIRPADSST